MSSATDVPWAVTPEKVEAVVRRLIAVARPRKIILFGSYVRGQTHRDSDLDVLVVTGNAVRDPHAEAVRLRGAVGDIDMPMDILVVPESQYERLRHRWDLIYHEATETGRVVYEQPATVVA
jgi:predicted nucleotidyltransferase